MPSDARAERMDRVAARLAESLNGPLTSLARLRESHRLSDAEAIRALASMLQGQGIQLNDGLLGTLVGSNAGGRQDACS